MTLSPTRKLAPLAPLLLAFAAFGCHAQPRSAQALAAGLPCQAAPKLSLPDPSEHTVSRSHGLASLSAMGRQAGIASGPSHAQLGHYESQLQSRITMKIVTRPIDREGNVVGCLSAFDISTTMSSAIHVAAELPPNGCSQRAVLLHEMRHHQIQVHYQRQGADLFFAKNSGPAPIFAGSKQSVDSRLNAYVAAYGQGLLDALEQYPAPHQRALDSPEEYARIPALCAAEIDPIMKRHFASMRAGR